jgi:leucine dehydrogenase
VARVAEEFGARAVGADDIYSVDADVFAPCAMGAVINDETIDMLKVDIVAGAANNQLARGLVHGPALHQRGILYAPDYVINAGGLINVYGELNDWTADRSKWKAGEIYGTLLRIFELAKSDGLGPHLAANKVAEARILEARHLQRTFRT